MWWDRNPYRRPAALLVVLLTAASLAGCNEYRAFAWGNGVSWQQARQQALVQQPDRTETRSASGPARHVVMPGDTVSELAESYRIPARYLASANGIGAPYRIYVGQVLEIPVRAAQTVSVRESRAASSPPVQARAVSAAAGAHVHIVSRGETVSSIAKKYGFRTGDILALNPSVDPPRLKYGTALRLPATQVRNTQIASAQVPEKAAPVTASARPDGGPIKVAALPAPRPRSQPPAVRSEPPELTGNGFVWPVNGEVISAFGPQPNGARNDGVNLRAAAGTSVIAVENGVVVYAGSDIPAFGRMLMIRHDGDYLSAYAHNSTLLVAEGDKVRRGQPIAKVGTTGHVLEPQLHFELRKGRDVVDPAKYLRGGNVQVAQKN